MAHRRKEIRDRIISNLTGLLTTGANVFGTRLYPLQTAELPGLCVFSEAEENEHGAAGGALDRLLTVLIEAYVKSPNADVDDQLDLIAEEIEAALNADVNLNGLAKNVMLLSTEFVFNTDSEQPVGIMSLRYQIFYRT